MMSVPKNSQEHRRAIVYVAKIIGGIYKMAIESGLKWHRYFVDGGAQFLVSLASQLPNGIIEGIEEFLAEFRKNLDSIPALKAAGTKIAFHSTLTIEFRNGINEAVVAEATRLAETLTRGEFGVYE